MVTPSAARPPEPLSELKQVERRMGRKLVAVVVFAAVVYAGLVLYGDFGALVQSMRQVSLHVVLLALLLSTGNFVVRYFRWAYYLRRLQVSVPGSESALVFVAGFSMALTPVRAGEVLKSLLLKETRDLPIAKTAPIMVAERVTDLGALVLLSALGCLSFPNGALLAALGAAGVAALLLMCAWRPLGEALLKLAGKLWFMDRLLPKIREAYETLWVLTGPVPFVVGLLLGTVAWGLQCLSLYVVADAFAELHLSLEASLFIYSAPLLAGTLAMLPGGLGLTEASMTALMIELGGPNASTAAAAAITLIVRLVALWWGVAVGFAALAIWRVRFGIAGAVKAAAPP
jgi:glycosyltransferase 2 family protein